jgi:hypothetical protein
MTYRYSELHCIMIGDNMWLTPLSTNKITACGGGHFYLITEQEYV